MIKLSLFLNGLCVLYLVWLMKKKHGYQQKAAFAMTICASSVSGFIISSNLQLIMIDKQHSILIVAVVSCLIGVLFGFIHSQTSGMIGYYHGLISGLMGAMLSIVIHNPNICHLPMYYADSIEQQAVLFSLFSCILSFITIFVVQLVHWKIDKGVRHVE